MSKNFEDIQTLWDSQNDENLFAINRKALHTTIRQKSKNIHKMVQFFEWVMIGVNLAVGLFFFLDLIPPAEAGYPILLPMAYTAFGLFVLVHRLRRRQDERQFPHTILGDLDKAMSQLDYLIRQGQSILWWYVIPYVLVFGLTAWFNAKYWPAFVFTLLLIPVCFFGVRWEINKIHLPKKRALEAIRAQLTTPEN